MKKWAMQRFITKKKKGLRLIFFKLKINKLQGEFDFFKKKLKLVLVNIKS